MIKLPYTVVLLNGNLTTGMLQLPQQQITGAQLRQRVGEKHDLTERKFRLYRQHDD